MKKQIEDYLHEYIPISKAMGIAVEEASTDQVILFAPFTNNINHKKTVFGGSLHAVATLACWSLLYVKLKSCHEPEIQENGNQIVIAKSEVFYRAPVDEDFKAVCLKPEIESWNFFIKTIKAKNKSRLELHATIHQKEKLCVDYHATFAVLKL